MGNGDSAGRERLKSEFRRALVSRWLVPFAMLFLIMAALYNVSRVHG